MDSGVPVERFHMPVVLSEVSERRPGDEKLVQEILWRCEADDLSLYQVSKLPGMPCLRTLRNWTRMNYCGLGQKYDRIRRNRQALRLCAAVRADYEMVKRLAARKEAGKRKQG